MIAVRTIWRYTKNTLQWPQSNSIIEAVRPGERCDWAEGGVYEHLGWAIPA